MRWAGLLDRMDRRIMATLNDGTATYANAAGIPVASGVAVMVERNLEHAGPGDMLITIPLAITWRKAELAEVHRGGVFTVGAASYIVEQPLSDDGQMMVAACMEAP